MRFPFSRIPRQTKVTAVVLGAALVQVGLLAWFGLDSTRDRLDARRREVDTRTRQAVSTHVVGGARERLAALEHGARQELVRAGGSAEVRVRRALHAIEELAQAKVFVHAFVADEQGGLWHWQRPRLEALPSTPDATARRRLDSLLQLEVVDPRGAAVAARGLADDIGEAPSASGRDHVARALALRVAWRAALRMKDGSQARNLAREVLDRYAALRDDRPAPMADSQPFGVGAAGLLCRVLKDVIHLSADRRQEFVETVAERRRLVQVLGPDLAPGVAELETEACRALLPTLGLQPEDRRHLEHELSWCDSIDAALAVVRRIPPVQLRSMLATGAYERTTIPGDPFDYTVLVLPIPSSEPPGPRLAAIFLADPGALRAYSISAARLRQVELPEGTRLLIRDEHSATLEGDPDAPSLVPLVSFGDAAPGLTAGAFLEDAAVLDSEIRRERAIWLWTLAGAGLAVVAASLLAVRAVVRELHLARMKSDFVSNLSHELRTPLTSLRMFVETLTEGRVRDEAERDECLGIIAQETDRLSRLVDRILQFAAYAKGKAPIHMQPTDVGDVVARAVKVFQKRAEQLGARIELGIDRDLPEAVTDRDAIAQVVLNLLDNAVKYGGENGAHIRVSVRAAGARVRIEVEDDGPGVPEGERVRVFEEFYRGNDTLAARVQGTGIGLALCNRISIAHGARIECLHSAALGGALFRLTLPDAQTGRRRAGSAPGEAA